MTMLSVVIPAYKKEFLAATLQSLAAQTVKDFEVVVADDCSPNALAGIVRGFEGALRLVYHRFPENVGGRSLVAHWSRSVRLATSPWIWLFSDDDLADPNCIKVLLAGIAGSIKCNARVLKFNTRIVDHEGRMVRVTAPFPPRLTPDEFVQGRMKMVYSSFACEYAFSRAAFDEAGGFVEFPAAWCSDDASWIAFAGGADIVTLDGAMVSWRRSDVNISSPRSGLGKEKAEAMIEYLHWLARRGISGTHKCGLGWMQRVLYEQNIALSVGGAFRAGRAISRFDESHWLANWFTLLRTSLRRVGSRRALSMP